MFAARDRLFYNPQSSALRGRARKDAVSRAQPPANRSWHRLATSLQRKPTGGEPGDQYEQEADRAASEVMQTTEPGVRRDSGWRCASGPRCRDEGNPQASGEPVQAKAAADPARAPSLPPTRTAALIRDLRGGKQLPEPVRRYFEPRMGHPFGNVSVHTGERAARWAHDLKARAFTIGRDIIFGKGQYAPQTSAGGRLLAHELTHVVQQSRSGRARIQRAEVDDNPEFCFPGPGGRRLADVSGHINAWINAAIEGAERAEAIALGMPEGSRVVNATRIGNAVYQELGAGGVRSYVEERIAALPETHVRHVSPSESRFRGEQWLPSLAGQLRTRRLSPVVNLCGVCVGADKLGHFFAQGYEYFRLGRLLRSRIQSWSDEQRSRFLERISPPVPESVLSGLTPEGAEPVRFELPREFREDQLIEVYTNEFGKWLEGFEHRLPPEEVRWIRGLDFIPWYYGEGVYGRAYSGALSRADLAANRWGGRFYLDLWRDPSMGINICNYVNADWNEYANLTTYEFPLPGGPRSRSPVAEEP